MERGVMFQFFEWHCPSDGTLWDDLRAKAAMLREMGVTAVWLPPAYKGLGGKQDVGYGVYDLFDLGEFDQKGSIRTKYGTKDAFIAAVQAVQDAGMHIYADVVFNHRMGGDETEEVEIEEIDWHDRNKVISDPYTIRAWSHYKFAGRAGRYSALQLNWEHFNAFGCNADKPDEKKIYRVVGKEFSGEVSLEYGNFDYLMGADVDTSHPEVREELFHWGRWFVELTDVHGFRLDAIKHIPAGFMRDWLEHLRSHFNDRQLFAVGEYWSGDIDELNLYMERTNHAMTLFDVPLHFRFAKAGKEGSSFDLRTIFDGTLVEQSPTQAVTFVDNHDSQPGQALASWVKDWFKLHAYALILLREHGYPCVFYGDYFGNENEDHRLTSHRMMIDRFLDARQKHTWGEQHDYFDDPHCIGWVWTGDQDHKPMVVLLSNAEKCTKQMTVPGGPCTFHDITEHISEPITTDSEGKATFRCTPGQLSVWCGG